jgi:ABC-type nitrate/sulfonate/bicarbonate transport system ATPase subunit
LDAIDLEGVTRGFDIEGARLMALDGLDLRVAEREIVAIVGPNGCGKSTLLRIASGLLPPDHGAVRVFGAGLIGVDPRIGLIFQEPRLLPWRDVLANVAFPLELAGVDREARETRAAEALTLAGLDGFAGVMPDQLSGGMAQRAALARALATDPRLLLLDEPFSGLDALTRERLDAELLTLWGQTGTTIVLVTHSVSEAVFLADRVLVMSPRPGRIVGEVKVRSTRAGATSIDGRDATFSDVSSADASSSAADQVRAFLLASGEAGTRTPVAA